MPKLQADVLELKQKLEAARLEAHRLQQEKDASEQKQDTGDDRPRLADRKKPASERRRPKVAGQSDAPPPFMYEELQRKVAECKELLQMTNELRNEMAATKLQLFQEKDNAAAAKSSADVRLENLEAQVLKLKGQVVEERQTVAEARRETQLLEERVAAADAAADAEAEKAAKHKALLDSMPKKDSESTAKQDDQEDEFERLHREAEQTALAVAEVDLQGRLRAMGVALGLSFDGTCTSWGMLRS